MCINFTTWDRTLIVADSFLVLMGVCISSLILNIAVKASSNIVTNDLCVSHIFALFFFSFNFRL